MNKLKWEPMLVKPHEHFVDAMVLIDSYLHFENVSGTTQEIQLYATPYAGSCIVFKKIVGVFKTEWFTGNIT